MIDLAGHEKAAAEKLDWALAMACEASSRYLYRSTCDALRRAVEAATELGTHRTDGRYAKLATMLDKARVKISDLTHAEFSRQSVQISEQLADIRAKVGGLMQTGRVVN